jgi:hypothetical protein
MPLTTKDKQFVCPGDGEERPDRNAHQQDGAVWLIKADSSCRPSVVLSSQQMHIAGDNPNNLELRSAPVSA